MSVGEVTSTQPTSPVALVSRRLRGRTRQATITLSRSNAARAADGSFAHVERGGGWQSQGRLLAREQQRAWAREAATRIDATAIQGAQAEEPDRAERSAGSTVATPARRHDNVNRGKPRLQARAARACSHGLGRATGSAAAASAPGPAAAPSPRDCTRAAAGQRWYVGQWDRWQGRTRGRGRLERGTFDRCLLGAAWRNGPPSRQQPQQPWRQLVQAAGSNGKSRDPNAGSRHLLWATPPENSPAGSGSCRGQTGCGAWMTD